VDVGTGVHEQLCGYRGVNAAGKTNKYFLTFHVIHALIYSILDKPVLVVMLTKVGVHFDSEVCFLGNWLEQA